MTNTSTRHLVGVWNPAYAADAMESTLEILLAFAQAAAKSGSPGDEDVYVWWGKVRSANRQQPLPHLAEILAIEDTLTAEDGTAQREVHLYLTDFRSLYVGHVSEITTSDPRQDDPAHVPAFYRTSDFSCDCWFQLWDIRRVVTDDTLAVVAELRQLRNVRYGDRPVSIYGGMVELPLIVTRDDGARYFEADVRERLTDGRFWVEFDAERTGVGRMERELRENLIGDEAWTGLDPTTRSFIATAESLFRAHRNDAAFDFSAVVVDFAKAFEVQTNTILRRALRDVPPGERRMNLDGQTVDLTRGDLWTLGQLAHAIGEERHINTALKRRLVNGEWFTASLPPVLRELATLRNPAAHSARIGRQVATELRNRMLGVGRVGLLDELGKVRRR